MLIVCLALKRNSPALNLRFFSKVVGNMITALPLPMTFEIHFRLIVLRFDGILNKG